jgi:hypothetical protein
MDRDSRGLTAAARVTHPRIRDEGEAWHGEQQTYGGGGGGGADEREEDDGGGEGAGVPLLPRRPRPPRARLVLAVAAAGHGFAAVRTGLGILSGPACRREWAQKNKSFPCFEWAGGVEGCVRAEEVQVGLPCLLQPTVFARQRVAARLLNWAEVV